MRIINVVTATTQEGKWEEMLEHLKSFVPISKKIWPDVGFHILTPRSGLLNRIIYVEQFPSMAVQEKWQESWDNYPEVTQIVRKQIELSKTESVETFELEASTADL